MSQRDDMERLRRVYDEWARGEYWSVDIYDPEIVFVLGDSLPEPGIYEGLEGMERGFRGWLESWRDLRFELDELIPAGEAIVAMYRQTATGRASGVHTELDGGHVWRMRDGKAVRLEVHSTRAAALAAAGLEARSDELMLAAERALPAPRPVVFEAFTDQGQLVKWWGPEGFTTPSLQFEPRVGESYRIEMQPPEGDPFWLIGEFREVAPPARLVFTFVWEDPDRDDVETLVALTFRDLGESTKVDLEQGPFKTEARRALHRDGWRESFDKLERLISGQA